MTSSRRESPMKPMCLFFIDMQKSEWGMENFSITHCLQLRVLDVVTPCLPVGPSLTPLKYICWATQNFFHFYNDEGATVTALGWITITDLFGMAHIIVFQKQKHLGSSHFEMFHKCKFKIPPCKSQRLASVGFIPTWEHVAGSLLTRPGFSR